MALLRNKTVTRSFYVCLGLVAFIFFLVLFVVPLVFKLFPSLMKRFIFVPDASKLCAANFCYHGRCHIHPSSMANKSNGNQMDCVSEEIPDNIDYKHPEKLGFVGGRNFYLKTEDGASLGVWYTLPANLEEEANNVNISNLNYTTSSEIYKDWLSDATVFLYLHGSAGTRTSPHRLRVYQLLNKLNYHLVTFDYRGYGDSTSAPNNETDLIVDTKTVFSWIRERVNNGRIYLWGHSLGTGVAAHFADEIINGGARIDGIILEAPFNNMASAVRASTLADAISFLPWFNSCFIDPLYQTDLAFESDKHLQNITTPLLILHAEDDKIIPVTLAKELYEDVLKFRKVNESIEIITYDRSLHYGHYNIALDPNLNETISQFVEKSGSNF